MSVEQINGDEYTVEYDTTQASVIFQGTIRLQGTNDYAAMMDLLQRAHDAGSALTLDFRGLQFLNSSGISSISRFIISARKQDQVAITVLGNSAIYWQQKSLSNLQKLWPKVKIEIA